MPYLALYTPTTTGFAAVVPELDTVLATGTTLGDLVTNLSQAVALHLHEDPGSPAPKARTAADLPASALAPYDAPPLELLITPAPINPVSLEIERLVEASPLSLRNLAKEVGTSHSALIRMMNPFYWGHSLSSLRQLGVALDVEPVLSFRPVALPATNTA
ncbi:hypothetical protein Q0M94_16895 (plasmid) [Deinococcus radiomollis]|uniref:type II toxin-antitoxin system HicB family antitoxin n=1 Tax=Deinococcus radiomollis TaxID=468916 RepID=UPI003892BFF5